LQVKVGNAKSHVCGCVNYVAKDDISSVIIAVITILAVLMFVVVLVVFLFTQKRRRRKEKSNSTSATNDATPLEDTGTHYSRNLPDDYDDMSDSKL